MTLVTVFTVSYTQRFGAMHSKVAEKPEPIRSQDPNGSKLRVKVDISRRLHTNQA